MKGEMYKRVAPHIDRVRYDGGSEPRNMADLFALQRMNEEMKDFIKLSYCPELTGNKIRVSGVNNFISKGYSTNSIRNEALINDLTQSTAVNQPYLDKIALTEKLGAKNPNLGTTYLSYPSISFGATDTWTLTTVFKWNGDNNAFIYLLGDVANNGVILRFNSINKFGFNLLSGAYPNVLWDDNSSNFIIGKTVALSMVYDGAYIELYVNGVSFGKKAWNRAAAFTSLFSKVSYSSAQKNYYLSIHSTAISSNQIKYIHSCLNSIFPEIESVQIGTKTTAVRNFDAMCSSNGVSIPDGTLTANWINGTAFWCYHTDSATGVSYGKLYNKAGRDIIVANPPSGWHVATEAELTSLSLLDGLSLKLAGSNYWTTANGTNTTGLSFIGSSMRNADGSFATIKSGSYIWCADSDKVLHLADNGTISIENIASANCGYSILLVKN